MAVVDLFGDSDVAALIESDERTAAKETPPSPSIPFEQQLAADLNAAYDALLTEHAQRKHRAEAIRCRIAETAGIAESMVEAALPDTEFEHVEVAQRILAALTDGRGRAFLRLDFDCEIDEYELRRQFIKPIEDGIAGRRYRSRGQTEEEFEALRNAPVPRLDIPGLIVCLKDKYGGDAGRKARLAQVVGRLFDALGLSRNTFEVAHGKVTLQIHAYPATLASGYSRGTQEGLYHFAVGLDEMFVERDEQAPPGLQQFRRRGIEDAAPGGRFDISPEVSLRYFKGHIRFVMAAAFAERLREFIAEFRG